VKAVILHLHAGSNSLGRFDHSSTLDNERSWQGQGLWGEEECQW
jgi:hypothetical protein